MKQISRAACFCGSLLLLTVAPLQAQSSGPYLRLDGGVNFVPGTSLVVGGFPGHLSLDSGYRVDAAAGYEFNRWVALELEGGFLENSISSLTLYNMTAHLQKSSLDAVPVLANVVLRYENSSNFVPFIALGAGGARSTLDISGDKDSQIVFVLQAQAGVIYKIDEQAWIELGYKLLGTAKQNYQIGGMRLETDEVLNHFIGAGVIWKF